MRTLTENWRWKLLALLISFALWIMFIGEVEVSMSVPTIVQFFNVPSDLEISSDQPERLFVKLRGPSTRLTPSDVGEISLRLNLSSVSEPGEHTFAIEERNLGLPTGVSLVRVVPSQIRLKFDRRITRTVPVAVEYSAPPPQGYRVVRTILDPPRVQIIGPEPQVLQVNEVRTDPVNLSSTVATTTLRVPLYLPDSQVRLEHTQAVVTVRLTIERISPTDANGKTTIRN
jgi:YbbR domain-containing protein